MASRAVKAVWWLCSAVPLWLLVQVPTVLLASSSDTYGHKVPQHANWSSCCWNLFLYYPIYKITGSPVTGSSLSFLSLCCWGVLTSLVLFFCFLGFFWLHWVFIAGFSLVVALGFSCPTACGILVPGFLTTGPPGKSLIVGFKKKFLIN